MMEHLFRARTLQSRSLDAEVYLNLHFSKKSMLTKILIIALYIIGFAMLCAYLILWKFYSNVEHALVVILWVVFLLLIYRFAFRHRMYARAREKERQKTIGNKLVYTDMLFFDNHFCFHSAISAAVHTVPYSDIVALDETKHYYLVRTNIGVFPFDKNGFVDGICDQAVMLLREKSRTGDGSLS